MEFYNDKNWDNFLKIIPYIRAEIEEWNLIHFFVDDVNPTNIKDIAQSICSSLSDWQGAAFAYSDKEILMIARLGKGLDKDLFKQELEQKIKEYKCTVIIKGISLEGLHKIEIALSAIHAPSSKNREEKNKISKTIMVVEDDMFTRSMICKALQAVANVIALENGKAFIEKYLEVRPQAVFLDIHLPYVSGLDLLSEVMVIDPQAYIVILSADSVTENILGSKARGAKGFITKPFTKEKVLASLNKCPKLVA